MLAVTAAIVSVVCGVLASPLVGALVLTHALADRYGVQPGQIATGCGAVTAGGRHLPDGGLDTRGGR